MLLLNLLIREHSMNNDRFFIELSHKAIEKYGNITTGDVFLYRKLKKENRIIAILSDGLGSGVKANILGTMTASMGLNFTAISEPVERMAEIIISTLPEDSQRKISYASFTIVDVDFEGDTRIIEYGNPSATVFRKGKKLQIEKTSVDYNKQRHSQQDLWVSEFTSELGDRIVFYTDGVTQSGIGKEKMPFGWETGNVNQFISGKLVEKPDISAEQLSRNVVFRAHHNDDYEAKDDTTCAVVYFRESRKLLVCSGPPYESGNDKNLAKNYEEFEGDKIICGGTTAKIIARETDEDIEMDLSADPSGIPPVSFMKSAALVTEGIITLGRVTELLEQEPLPGEWEENAAGDLIKEFLDHDCITFIVGTKVNNAHQDPSLPTELGIRRNQIKKIARILEHKFLKEIQIKFI